MLRIQCKNGVQIYAATYSYALLHWYGYFIPDDLPPNPEVLKPYISNRKIVGPYDPMFLTVALATVESQLGSGPEISEKFSDSKWHEDLPQISSWKDIKASDNPKVKEYERTCLEILQWIKNRGEILSIEDVEEPV